QRLYVETARRIKKIARKIAGALRISGPFNIQFLAKENEIKVIECNLRASRSFPFVSKVLKINFIELATKVMLGMHPAAPQKSAFDLDYVGVKSSQFSFARLEEADPMLGVDMSSTGEVGCLGDDLNEALIKATLSVGNTIPKKKILLSTGDPLQKADMLTACKLLASKGYELYATGGTYKYFIENSIPCTRVLWPSECDNPNFSRYRPALELIQNKEVEMVINIPKNFSGLELNNGYILRRNAIDFNIPLFTNARLAVAFIKAFCTLDMEDIQIKSWDEY
ncbi:MAG: ATP-grasp domain-containing protein, partial [Bacteroidales bacterium]|nr:ATP-grasp domain-containing protein [Bacteroidales bacterium]